MVGIIKKTKKQSKWTKHVKGKEAGGCFKRKISLMGAMLSKNLNEAREDATQICGKVCYRLRAQQVQDQKKRKLGREDARTNP